MLPGRHQCYLSLPNHISHIIIYQVKEIHVEPGSGGDGRAM